ncbi:unnamed protein product [Pieris macdunnoughi]|nr:unnamed protein product [Pieris macdunnoughi]
MNPARFLRRQIQTTANQIIPSHYDMAKNSKSIGATQETPHHYDKLCRSPIFDVNSKLINDCIEPINHNGSNKQTKHDMLNLKSSVPLNGIKAIYYPSNNKSSLLYNGIKNNVNCDCIRTNAEGVFIQPNLAIDNSFVKCDIKNIVPESIESSINHVPRCYLGRNNLTSRQDGNSINQNISGVVYKIPEVHPSIDEPYIIHPNSISKNYMENLSNSIKCYALPSLSSPINLNNEDKERMYTSPMYVQPTPIKVYPQQTTINVKSIHNTPVISAAPYTVQAPKYSFYEINKPKVTFLNPTKAQNPEGYKNPTVTTIAPKVLQQNDSNFNSIKPKVSNVNVLANTGYQVHSPINKYNSLLSASLNNITSVIVSNILSSLNKDISKTLKKPLSQGFNVTPISCEIPTFEVTHPCIESPRYLPETPIKIRKDNSTSTATNRSSKPSVSTITINVLPPVQQISNDIIIIV